MINLGDTFIADGHEWKVVSIDDTGFIDLELHYYEQTYIIKLFTMDKSISTYRKFKNGKTRIWWTFSFEEIKMINEIIGRVAT